MTDATTDQRPPAATYTEDQLREMELDMLLDRAFEHEPVHRYFELSYCSYKVLPRSVLQSMPVEWQRKFVQLLEQIPETLDVDDMPESYRVTAIGDRGRFKHDPYSDYERGRRRIPMKAVVGNG